MTYEVYISFDDIDQVTAITVYEALEDDEVEVGLDSAMLEKMRSMIHLKQSKNLKSWYCYTP